MTDRIPLAQLTKAALDQLYDDLDDLRRQLAESRSAEAILGRRVVGWAELAKSHQHWGQRRWNAWKSARRRAQQQRRKLDEVRDLRDDLRGITGARYIADALDSILDETAAGPPATQATDQPEPATITDPEWLKQQYAQALAAEDVNWGYDHGFGTLDDPETAAFADAVLAVRDRHLQQLRQRLTLADATLREILTGGQITGDRITRWRAVLDELTEQQQPLRGEDGQIICTCTNDTPCGCGTSVHYQPKEH